MSPFSPKANFLCVYNGLNSSVESQKGAINNSSKDVPLRTRRAVSLYNVYGDSALMVHNGTSSNIESALLALN